MAFGTGVYLRQKLPDPPRLGICFEHPRVTVVGNEKMCPTAIVKYVNVVWRQFCRFVQCLHRSLSVSLLQLDDSQPHPGVSVFGVGGSFLLQGGNCSIQPIRAKFRHSKKKICPPQSRFQLEGPLKTGNRVPMPALLFTNQSEVQI